MAARRPRPLLVAGKSSHGQHLAQEHSLPLLSEEAQAHRPEEQLHTPVDVVVPRQR